MRATTVKRAKDVRATTLSVAQRQPLRASSQCSEEHVAVRNCMNASDVSATSPGALSTHETANHVTKYHDKEVATSGHTSLNGSTGDQKSPEDHATGGCEVLPERHLIIVLI